MKIGIFTLGCKVNQYESDAIGEKLTEKGHTITHELEYADMYILNTCAVTNEAEKKSRQMFAKFNKLNPNAKIIVCGCASEKNAEQFRKLKNCTFITGVANKLGIIDNIENIKTDIKEFPAEYENEMLITRATQGRAYIKVQDGCNNFCSYCIIPYLRGRSRSRNLDLIINEAKQLSTQVNEIVITGIDISDYRIDKKLALDQLLLELDKLGVRLRIGSLEVRVVKEEFVKNIASMKNLCPHFHLSLQSGSDGVLKRMNRKYTTKDYYNAVRLLRKYFKNPAITTDVIVGFPEESEKEFKETYKFIKKVGFSSLHIFPYSVREGTPAQKMKQVDGKIKTERVKLLQKLENKLTKNYFRKCKNKKYDLLIEEKVDNYFVGHTENYLKVYISGNYKINEIVKVKIKKQYKDGYIAIKGE